MANPLLDGVSKIVTNYVYAALYKMATQIQEDLQGSLVPTIVQPQSQIQSSSSNGMQRISRKDHPERKCLHCGIMYKPVRIDQKYHDRECAKEANTIRERKQREKRARIGNKIQKAKSEKVA